MPLLTLMLMLCCYRLQGAQVVSGLGFAFQNGKPPLVAIIAVLSAFIDLDDVFGRPRCQSFVYGLPRALYRHSTQRLEQRNSGSKKLARKSQSGREIFGIKVPLP